MKISLSKMKEIPVASLGILCMVESDIPVRELISHATYIKHRAILKAHGFDIHQRVLEGELKSYKTA